MWGGGGGGGGHWAWGVGGGGVTEYGVVSLMLPAVTSVFNEGDRHGTGES